MDYFSSHNEKRIRSTIYNIDVSLEDHFKSTRSLEKKVKEKCGNVIPAFLTSNFSSPHNQPIFQSSNEKKFRKFDNIE